MSMKKILCLVLALGFAVSTFAQFDAFVKRNPKAVGTVSGPAMNNIDLPVPGEQPPNGILPNKSILTDPITASTVYDLQTNGAMQNRCYLYSDGFIGTVCTWSQSSSSYFPDRGTGYNNYSNGIWGPEPTARIESVRTG